MGVRLEANAVKTKLVCVVPVYNEQDILPKAIPLLSDALTKQVGDDFTIIIADNGSVDNTSTVASELAQQSSGRIVHELIKQKGRGNALHAVFKKHTSDHAMFIDVDLPCALDDLAQHIAALDNGADLVISRRVGPRPLGRRVMTLALRIVNRLVFGIKVADSQCSVKAISAAASKLLVENCQQDGWFLDTELVVMCAAAGLKIKEVPIHWLENRFVNRPSKVAPIQDMRAGLKAIRQIKHNRQRFIDRHTKR